MLPSVKMTASSTYDGADACGAENVCNVTHHAPVDWARLHVLAEGQNPEDVNNDTDAQTVKEERHARENTEQSRQIMEQKTDSQRFLEALVLLEGELQAHEIALSSIQDGKWQSSGILPPNSPYLALERDGYFLGEHNATHPLEAKQQPVAPGSQQQVRRLLFTSAVVDSVLPTLFANYDQRFQTMRRASHAAHERNRNLLKYLVESHKSTVGELNAINITSELAQKKLSENFAKLKQQNAEMSVQLETAQKAEHSLRNKSIWLTDELLQEKERGRQAVRYMIAESDMLMNQLEHYKNLCAEQQQQIGLLTSRKQTDSNEQIPEQAIERSKTLGTDEEAALNNSPVVTDNDLDQYAVNPVNARKPASKFAVGLTTISERLSENDYALRRSDVSDAGDRSDRNDAASGKQQELPNTEGLLSDAAVAPSRCDSSTRPEYISQKQPQPSAVGELLARKEIRIKLDPQQGAGKVRGVELAFGYTRSAHRRSNFSFYSSSPTKTKPPLIASNLTSASCQDEVKRLRSGKKRSFAEHNDDDNVDNDGTVPASFSSSSSSSSASSSASSSPTVSSPVLLVNCDDDDDSSSEGNGSSDSTSGEEVDDEIIDVSDEKRSSSVRRMPAAAASTVLPSPKQQSAVVIPESGIVGMTSHAHLFVRPEPNENAESSSVVSNSWKPKTIPSSSLLAALANYADDEDEGDDSDCGVDPWVAVSDAVVTVSNPTIENSRDPIRVINAAPPVPVIATTSAQGGLHEKLPNATAHFTPKLNDSGHDVSSVRAPRKSAILPPRNIMLLPATKHNASSAAAEALNAAFQPEKSLPSKLKQPTSAAIRRQTTRKNDAGSDSNNSASPESEETIGQAVCSQPTTTGEYSVVEAITTAKKSAKAVTKKSSTTARKKRVAATDSKHQQHIPDNLSSSMVIAKSTRKVTPREAFSQESTPATRSSTRRSLRLQNKASQQHMVGTEPPSAGAKLAINFESSSPSSVSSSSSASSPSASPTSPVKIPIATKIPKSKQKPSVTTKPMASTANVDAKTSRMSMATGFRTSSAALGSSVNGYSYSKSHAVRRGAPVGLEDGQLRKSSSVSQLSMPPSVATSSEAAKSVVKMPATVSLNNSRIPTQLNNSVNHPSSTRLSMLPMSASTGGLSGKNQARRSSVIFLPLNNAAKSSCDVSGVGDFGASKCSNDGKTAGTSQAAYQSSRDRRTTNLPTTGRVDVSRQQKIMNVNNQ